MKYVFPMIPASSGPVWLFVVIAVFMLCLVSLFGYLAYSSRHVRLAVSDEGIRIEGDIYGREIPAASLVMEELKVLNLRRDGAYRLTWRTNGAGLPGYKSGWFKLANGGKALAFLTDPTRVLYIPTRDGYSVLISVAEPEEVKQALLESLTRREGGGSGKKLGMPFFQRAAQGER